MLTKQCDTPLRDPLAKGDGQCIWLGQTVHEVGYPIKPSTTAKLCGFNRKNQTVLVNCMGRKLIAPASDYGLVFAASAKPTKAEKANPNSHAANLPALLQCWHNNEWHEQGNMATGPFFSQLLAMARDADKWVAYKKRWPILAAQLDK